MESNGMRFFPFSLLSVRLLLLSIVIVFRFPYFNRKYFENISIAIIKNTQRIKVKQTIVRLVNVLPKDKKHRLFVFQDKDIVGI